MQCAHALQTDSSSTAELTLLTDSVVFDQEEGVVAVMKVCTKNEELCIENEDFALKMMNCAGTRYGRRLFSHARRAVGKNTRDLSIAGMYAHLTATCVLLKAHLGSYRRGRRAFVAKTFSQCFDFINQTGNSATQIFSRVDVDGAISLEES